MILLPLLAGCANGTKLLDLEPDAKQGDLKAVAADQKAIKRDQQGLVNAQAEVRTELNGIREVVTNNAVPRDVWWVMLAMLAFSNLDQLGRWLPSIVGAFPCWIRGRRHTRRPTSAGRPPPGNGPGEASLPT